MGQPKHTPGPWLVHEQDAKILADDELKTVICLMGCSMNAPGALEDARLIAAAPQLLECLIDARSFIASALAALGDGHRAAELMEDFDEAIRKATEASQ